MQGRRPKQEDRHVKVPDLTKAAKALKMPIDHLDQPCGFFAVYDGHQGQLCAEFAAKAFHVKLLKRLSAQKSRDHWTEERVSEALRQVCEELDTEFLAKYRTAPDGCTAVVALVTGARLFVAWVGDSRCLLCRTSSQGDLLTVALTEDHRPSVPAESERVKKAGGAVVNFDGCLRVAHLGFEERVREIRRAQAQGLGTIGKEPVALAVSRALGDRHFKAVTGKAILVHTPSIRCLKLDASHKFFALMCDGISDVMRNEEIIFELNYERDLSDKAANIRAVCGALVQEAYNRGSEDNLTVILVQLAWSGDGKAKGSGKPAAAAAEAAGAGAAKRRRLLAQEEEEPAGGGLGAKTGPPAAAGGGSGSGLGPGRFLFRGQAFWQEVLPEHVAVRQLEFKMGIGDDSRNYARSASAGDGKSAIAAPAELLSEDDPRLLEAAMSLPTGREDETAVAAALRRAASRGGGLGPTRRLIASSFASRKACDGALFEAASRGHEDVVRELLRARASPSAVDAASASSTGLTALHAACRGGYEAAAKLLMEARADLGAKDAAGRSPCEWAREMDLGPMARRLEALASEGTGPSK